MHKAGGGAEMDSALSKVRICAVSCGLCPLIYAAVICGVYFGWMNKGIEYDDKVPNWQGDISAFDTCGGIFDASTNSAGNFAPEFIDTKWSVLLAFNSYFFMLHCIMTFLILLGVTGILWPCCILGGCGHCFGGCAHLACIIVTGVFRFSDEGERCAESKGIFTTDGDTFEDLGSAIKSLFIAQCVLMIFVQCCVSVTMQVVAGVVQLHFARK